MLIWIHDINNTKQIFHAYLLNIDIKQIGMEWIRVNQKQKKKAWNICFIICHQHQTRSGKIKANKTQQISVKIQVFFRKNKTTTYLTATPSKLFYIIFVDIFFWNH